MVKEYIANEPLQLAFDWARSCTQTSWNVGYNILSDEQSFGKKIIALSNSICCKHAVK